MLTIFKQIFVWWNQQTLGTRMYTFFYGKLVGEDQLGNKYYENKKKTKDGLSMEVKLTHQKFQMNGTHGCILQKIS